MIFPACLCFWLHTCSMLLYVDFKQVWWDQMCRNKTLGYLNPVCSEEVCEQRDGLCSCDCLIGWALLSEVRSPSGCVGSRKWKASYLKLHLSSDWGACEQLWDKETAWVKLASESILSMEKFEAVLPQEGSYPPSKALEATTLLKSL